MSQANHQFSWQGAAARAAFVGCSCGCGLLGLAMLTLPHVPEVQGEPLHPPRAWPASFVPGAGLTTSQVFEPTIPGVARAGGSIGARWRLAGTFVMYGGDDGPDSNQRQAVLEDITGGRQSIVSEGERIDDVTVVSIFQNSVVLRGPMTEEQLFLSFSGKEVKGGTNTNAKGASGDGQLLSGNRFGGRQIAERTWEFRRDTIMDYYSELMDNPERLVKVFDSLKPVYDQNQKIAGYRLEVEGEADFFRSAGLQESDTIRTVNSVRMTNRRQAERFIRDFVANKANAFVIDVERNGQTQKMVYQLQ